MQSRLFHAVVSVGLALGGLAGCAAQVDSADPAGETQGSTAEALTNTGDDGNGNYPDAGDGGDNDASDAATEADCGWPPTKGRHIHHPPCTGDLAAN
jgi:hypothetical protein